MVRGGGGANSNPQDTGGPRRWGRRGRGRGGVWTVLRGGAGVSRMVTTTLAVFCFSLHLNSSSSSSFRNSLGVVILHHHLLLFVVVTGGGGDVRCCVHQSSSPPRSYFGHKLKVELLSLLPRTSHAPPPPPPLGLLPPAAERCVYGCCSASVCLVIRYDILLSSSLNTILTAGDRPLVKAFLSQTTSACPQQFVLDRFSPLRQFLGLCHPCFLCFFFSPAQSVSGAPLTQHTLLRFSFRLASSDLLFSLLLALL